jgi:hypothetical protein
MQCADTTKARWQHQLIGSVQKWCTEMKTRELLTTILMDGIMQWLDNKLLQPAKCLTSDFVPPFNNQTVGVGGSELVL